jgi:hypothetical protein
MRHPHTVAQLYGLLHGILLIFNTILYENQFQNPPIFLQTNTLFPEQSTLNTAVFVVVIWSKLNYLVGPKFIDNDTRNSSDNFPDI